MKTTVLTVIMCGLILTTVFLGGDAFAQSALGDQSRISQEVLPREETTIQKTAVVALRQIAQARADIHRKAYAQARHELDEAERLTHTIRQELSTANAKNLIEIAIIHLDYEPPRHVLSDLPPIYAAIHAIDITIPTDNAKRHLDHAKVCLDNGDRTGAQQELKLAVRSLLTIEVELPLLSVEKYIVKAQAYLAHNDAPNAERSLIIAEQRVEDLSLTVTSPLFRAKNNIWLAFQNYSASRMSEAKKQLELAEINLEQAANSGDAWVRQEAGRLSREIAGLKVRLDSKEPKAESALLTYWGRSKALVERSTEYLVSRWEKEKTVSLEDNNLIEAKLHAGYAETYHLTAREPSKAAVELDLADSYLKKALHDPFADNAAKISIRGLEKDILELKSDSERSDSRIQGKARNTA
jgi:hypothetical protein